MSQDPISTNVTEPAGPQPREESRLGARFELEGIRPGIWLAIASLVVAAVYSVALEGEFVWDDVALVAAVERTVESGPISHLFLQPFWSTDELDVATRSYYRPLTTFSFGLDFLLHHRNSAGFRATNLLLHLLNTALLFQCCRRANRRPWLAALLATLWAIQPRLTESVAWISGRTDVLCGTFALAALLLWRPTLRGRLLTSALLFLALLAKETAIAAVGCVLAFEMALAPIPRRRVLAAMTPPLLATLAYAILRISVMHDKFALADSLAWGDRPRVVFEAIATYTWMLVNPWQPRTQIGSIFQPRLWLAGTGAIILLFIGGALVRYARRVPKEVWAWLVLLVVPLILVSHAVPIATNVVAADRFLYLPTAAIVLLCAKLRVWSQPKVALVPVFLGLSFLPLTLRRAPDWADPVALWTGTCIQSSSRNSLALLEVGNLEYEAGNFARALAIFSGLQQHRSQSDIAFERAATNQAIALTALGRYAEARTVLEGVVQERPNVPKFWYDLATTQLRNGDFIQARRSLRESLALMPDYTDAATLLENLAELEGSYRMLEARPKDRATRAALRTRLGFFHEAEEDWLSAIAVEPAPPEPILRQALAFVAEHGTAEAVDAILGGRAAWQHLHPELLDALVRKQTTAKRLRNFSLVAYGIVP